MLFKNETGAVLHWCPGCGESHKIPIGSPYSIKHQWAFNNDFIKPTFSPSVRIRGKRRVFENGRWTGEWIRNAEGEPVAFCCHYFIENGKIRYCSDSTHALAGQTIDLPEFPS